MQRIHRLAALLLAAVAASGASAQSAPGTAPPAGTPAPATAPAPGGPQPASAVPTRTGAKPGGRKKTEKAAYQGPSEADIRVAYTDRINAINAGTAQYLDPAAAAKLTIRVVKVEIVECAAIEERKDLYVCNILLESGVGEGVPEFRRVEVAMVKEKDAWRVQ